MTRSKGPGSPGGAAGKLEITLVKGIQGSSLRQKRTVWSLGLRHREQKVVHDDTPAIRGKVAAVSHLLYVKEVA